LVEGRIATLCAPATAARKPDGPHAGKYINVFVNKAAALSMTNERFPKFPPGSVIVKEKLATPDSLVPELLTAMVKREKGFNPEMGDWEFLTLSGDAKTVQEQGKLKHCSDCHSAKRDYDFVFRNYLTRTDWEKMK
jgi:hypothetical protein